MSDKRDWVVWGISDADEPEDLVRAGLLHRDFDGVLLLLVPDGEPGDFGWYGTEKTHDGRPTRPLLLFFRGEAPEADEASAWVEKCAQDSKCGPAALSLRSFDDYGATEATRTVAVHLSYPPYPWLDEAKLGMQMGRYFPDVETIDSTEPTESQPGVYHFRFFQLDTEPGGARLTRSGIDLDDLPF